MFTTCKSGHSGTCSRLIIEACICATITSGFFITRSSRFVGLNTLTGLCGCSSLLLCLGLRLRGCVLPNVSVDVLIFNTSPDCSICLRVALTVGLLTPNASAICLSDFSGVAFNWSRIGKFYQLLRVHTRGNSPRLTSSHRNMKFCPCHSNFLDRPYSEHAPDKQA